MFRRIFLDHPASVGESYLQHFAVALSFGLAMLGAGLAVCVHAFVPAAFPTTGSRTIVALNKRIVEARAAARLRRIEETALDWVI